MTCPDGEDDEAEYIAGDPERSICEAPLRLLSERPEHPFWRALTAEERIAVVRWLQCGEARGLLNALASNPSSPGLRSFVAEALAGGPETGWKLRIASHATGGRPTNADKAKLSALQAAVAGDGGDVATSAATLAGSAIGARSRKGGVYDPMHVANMGMVVELFRMSGKNYEDATMDAALDLAVKKPRGGDDPKNLKNVRRLYDEFLGAGKTRTRRKRK